MKMCEKREYCTLLAVRSLPQRGYPEGGEVQAGILETRMLTYTKVELVYQSGPGLGLGSH